jgi:penicillin-binding protein 1A
MRKATYLSVNTYYVQLIKRVGPEKVVEMAHKLGIQSDVQPYVSLALGTEEVSPFELASAYATLANGGIYCKPFAVTQVTDAAGKVLMHSDPKCERRISTTVAAAATAILRGVAEVGTGRANGNIGRPVAEKTGTTDNYTDAWFGGYTPQYATVVWLGYKDSNKHSLYNIHGLPKVFGGSLPAMIWAKYMRYAHRGLSIEQFPVPPPVKKAAVPSVVGKGAEDAQKILEDAGFSVKIVLVESKGPDGTVLSQSPAAKKIVEVGLLITLNVSGTPPAPSPSPSPSPTATTTKKP